jgi:hypothetical protein
VLQEFNAILQRIIAQAEKKAGSLTAAAPGTAAVPITVPPSVVVSAAAADASGPASAAAGGAMQQALSSAADMGPGTADGKQQQQQQALSQSTVREWLSSMSAGWWSITRSKADNASQRLKVCLCLHRCCKGLVLLSQSQVIGSQMLSG